MAFPTATAQTNPPQDIQRLAQPTYRPTMGPSAAILGSDPTTFSGSKAHTDDDARHRQPVLAYVVGSKAHLECMALICGTATTFYRS